jgi:chemotaxis response regulator CheB
MIKYILIHSQKSITTVVKQIISRLKAGIPIEIYNSVAEVDQQSLSRDDVVFLLQDVGEEGENTVSQMKMRAMIVGSGEAFKKIKIPHNIPSNIIQPSCISELTDALETIFYNIENKIVKNTETTAESAFLQYNSRRPRKIDFVMIGVSTGGPGVLEEFLKDINKLCVPILIAQHLPKGFSSQLSLYLQEGSKNIIVEVSSKVELKAGQIAIAQSGFDVEVIKQNDKVFAVRKDLNDDPFHPSIDRLFLSASSLEETIAAIVLTGMGKDGTIGAKSLKAASKFIIAQEPSTCVVDGMPRSIIESGLSDAVLTPKEIVEQINAWSKFYE